MDTSLIYNYLAVLKTGYCNSLEEYKRYVIATEIEFRAAYTQYLAETEGKGYNLILSDFKELERCLKGGAIEGLEETMYEQMDYALGKTTEAIDYIKRARTMFDSGEETEPQPKIKIKDSDERVISGTEGLAKFLGCSKSMAFSIIKNGVLIENGIQYKVGNTWKFNAERLRRFLHQSPHFLQDIRCIR